MNIISLLVISLVVITVGLAILKWKFKMILLRYVIIAGVVLYFIFPFQLGYLQHSISSNNLTVIEEKVFELEFYDGWLEEYENSTWRGYTRDGQVITIKSGDVIHLNDTTDSATVTVTRYKARGIFGAIFKSQIVEASLPSNYLQYPIKIIGPKIRINSIELIDGVYHIETDKGLEYINEKAITVSLTENYHSVEYFCKTSLGQQLVLHKEIEDRRKTIDGIK